MRGRRIVPAAGLSLALLVVVSVNGCAASPPSGAPSASASPAWGSLGGSGPAAPSPAAVRAAITRLAALTVDRGGATAPYDRAAFGVAWADVDGNGCDTRNDVLGRDLRDPAFRPGALRCAVTRGTLVDPYDGVRVAFASGYATSQLVQVDHIVSLSYAWRHGAEQWDERERLVFANDPRDLVAVSKRMNDDKGPFGPGEWLPPTAAGRCSFVARWVEVMAAYRLTVHPGDRAAAASVLSSC